MRKRRVEVLPDTKSADDQRGEEGGYDEATIDDDQGEEARVREERRDHALCGAVG